MNSAPLPATVYCLGTAKMHAKACPATPAQAYRLGHGEQAYWLARSCEVA